MKNSLRFAVLTGIALTAASCGGKTDPCSDARAKLDASAMDIIDSGNDLFNLKTDGPQRDAAVKKHRNAKAAEAAAHDAIAKYCPK